MKTLKTLFALLAVMLVWHGTRAQCAQFYTWPFTGSSDTVRVYPYVSNWADSVNATITVDFGDGTPAVPAYGGVQHIYTDSGLFQICLNYTSAECTSTSCDTVLVTSTDLCNENLWITTSITGSNVTFSVPNAPVGAIYHWSFSGGASISTSLSSNPTVQYSSSSYTAVLDISYGECLQTLTASGQLNNNPNNCNATWNYASYGKDVSFYTNSTIYTTTTYFWQFGDGDTSSAYYPTHSYSALGNYNVCLTVRNGNCIDSFCRTIALTAPTCVPSDSLFYIYNPGLGETIFSSYGTNRINPDVTYNWDFGDGTTAQDSASIGHIYTAAGNYTVCLNYADEYCTVSKCQNLLIENCPINAQIVKSVLDSNSMMFTVSQWQSDWTYAWSFSNGYTSTDSVVEMTFANNGTYTVTLTISSPTCTGVTVTTDVNVGDSTFCYLGISLTRSGDYTVLVNVLGGNQIPVTSRLLDYGDGFTTDQQFAHTYSSAGTYQVCLTYNTDVCGTLLACQQITVGPPIQYGLIYGTIYKGGNPACNGVVYFIQENNDTLSVLNLTYFQDTLGACSGNYWFYAPVGSNIKIKAWLTNSDPDFANYLPTYYGDELNWIDGTTLTIETTASTNADIHLIAGTNLGGPGFIGGLVSEGAGLGMIHDYQNRGLGDPIPNVQINLLTENDVPVAYTFTDGGGMYSFNQLAYGTYKVYAEVIGKTPFPQLVTINANNPSANNVNVDINSHSAVTGINDIAALSVDAVYPNPVKDAAIISFTAKQSTEAKVEVSDVRGVVIHTSTTDINTGSNQLKINLANHAAGVYVVSITNSDNKKIVKLLKAE